MHMHLGVKSLHENRIKILKQLMSSSPSPSSLANYPPLLSSLLHDALEWRYWPQKHIEHFSDDIYEMGIFGR